ncbi:MAG: choline-sulfatase [Boseongicola sp. SB0664_bin_43]|uniref:Choline-sulfatase n=1 Tax=Boseongicola sp. SB0664_bin_43 TaxID=2604844 RepID=A0A6B0Y2A8_9RHOB|nr:choline-sulfatase [Boseongicola sp. SB0664_bin_43]MYK32408.1 choline-sulfatase [Boseongicola sp. SB0670_bin_30]
MRSQPNILLIEADQLAAFVLPTFDPKGQAKTPNLDALARDGVVFQNAYSNSPLCCPSRASKFTGRLPSSHEVWGNGAELRSEIPTFMHFLRSAGYHNVVSGKCHFIGADQLHGFDRRLTPDMYPSRFDWTIDWSPGVEHREGTSVSKLAVSGLCRTNNQLLYDTEVQFRALEYLRYEALEAPGRPFFLHVSYTQPHDAYQTLPEYWNRYADVDIRLPELPPDASPHEVTRWLHIHHGIDRYPPDEATVIASRRAYFAMISHLDDFVGELVAELRHLGLYENTIIIFCSDHGDMLGERNMWFKRTFFEGSLRVPLIFHAPGRFAPGEVTQNVSLADLCPTLSELGGAGESSDAYGSPDSASFVSLLEGDLGDWQNEVIAEYFGPGVEEPWLCVRQDNLKYVWTRNHPELLFDLDSDPGEQTDLSRHPGLMRDKKTLKEKLLGRYGIEEVTARALASKRTRTFLHKAMEGSDGYVWDHQPKFDATRQYVRGVNSPRTA